MKKNILQNSIFKKGKRGKQRFDLYKLPSFRIERKKFVQVEIDAILKQLVDHSIKLKKSEKILKFKRLDSLCYFDRKDMRSFLSKYITFNKVVLKVDITKYLCYILDEFEAIAFHKGVVQSLKIFKDLYTVALRIATNNTFEPIKFLKTNSKGEPKLLGPLLDLLYGNRNERRACLAVLQVLKLVEQWDNQFSVDTIVKKPLIEPIGYDQQCWVGNYLTRLFKLKRKEFDDTGLDFQKLRFAWSKTLNETFPLSKQKNRIKQVNKSSKLHLSGRNGPNGPCLTTVVLDHGSLVREPELLETITQISAITKNKDLTILLKNFEEEVYLYENLRDPKKRPINSKISLKKESWGRLRPFAICDYLSHSSLRGFHDYLYRWLREQPEDGTYNQDGVSEAVRVWTAGPLDEQSSSESADLSAATDSIPLEIQCEIVEQIMGPHFAKLWRKAMGNRNFKVPNSNSFVQYRRGQPMGMSSSWPMLAVWHHCVARTVLNYLKIDRSTVGPLYYTIGDDISLKGHELFSIYEKIVQGLLGVGISRTKGFHMDTRSTTNPYPSNIKHHINLSHTAELAKRVYCNGEEITVIPPDEVKTSFEDPSQFKELLFSLKKRDYPELCLVTEIPVLTSLSRDKKLALTLCTNPLNPAPQFLEGNLHLGEIDPYKRLYWYNTNRTLEEIKISFFHEVRGMIVKTLADAIGLINQWIERAFKDGEVEVKDWEYTCETQGLVLFLAAERCKIIASETLKELYDSKLIQQGDPGSWNTLMKELKKVKVLFDIDLAFKGKTSTKKESQFVNNFTTKVIKNMIKQDQPNNP